MLVVTLATPAVAHSAGEQGSCQVTQRKQDLQTTHPACIPTAHNRRETLLGHNREQIPRIPWGEDGRPQTETEDEKQPKY